MRFPIPLRTVFEYALVITGALVFAYLLTGCGYLERVGERAAEVGVEPIAAVPRVVGNPADLNAWSEILQALIYITLGAGAKPLYNVVRSKVNGKPAS